MVILPEEANLIVGEILKVTFALSFRVRDKRIFKNIVTWSKGTSL